jgi:tRNA G18 (ribose-2'-O)-methylase SpoU
MVNPYLPPISSEYRKLKRTFATLPSGENVIDLEKYIPANKTLIMFGSEANGLSDHLKKFATKNLTIKMKPNVESLNLSISVAIIMYKLGNK